MAEFTVPEALRHANRHQLAGRLPEAEAIVRTILGHDPHCLGALQILGILALQTARFTLAADALGLAARLAPHEPGIQSNLGEALRHLGRLDEAIACYRQALALQPDFHNALGNLGLALTTRGRLDEAADCLRQAIALKPDFAEAHNNLGNIHWERKELSMALECYQRAVALQPQLAIAHNNIGAVHCQSGRPEAAIACHQRALSLNPNLAEGHNGLGLAAKAQGKLDAALACFDRAIALKPDFAEAHANRGEVLAEADRLDEALLAIRRAIEIRPDLAGAHHNLGSALKDRGQLEEAIASFRRAVELRPDLAEYHSSLVLALHYRCGDEAELIAAELRRWNERHGRPAARSIVPHDNDRTPDRRLKIGYLSADFRTHAAGWFLRTIFGSHDREAFELFAYSNVRRADALTAEFRARAEHWRDLAALSDSEAAELMRNDRIDILIDLSQHTDRNRLPVLGYKPAPIQVSYLGYPGKSGVETIDYRLTDPFLDPPAPEEPPGPEQPFRLPNTYWCYQPVLRPSPEVTPLPASALGCITFGCLNNFCKVSPAALAAWGRVLQAVPTARLMLHTVAGGHRAELHASFARSGINPERILFAGFMPPPRYFQAYQSIDIGLDPFPFAGGTTTCDALWMGVPVITLAGPTSITRGGLSLLGNVGLPELVAHSVDEYVSKAVDLARQPSRLAEQRASLRDKMQRSPLMDAPRFVRNLEVAYRAMWSRWCRQAAPSATG